MRHVRAFPLKNQIKMEPIDRGTKRVFSDYFNCWFDCSNGGEGKNNPKSVLAVCVLIKGMLHTLFIVCLRERKEIENQKGKEAPSPPHRKKKMSSDAERLLIECGLMQYHTRLMGGNLCTYAQLRRRRADPSLVGTPHMLKAVLKSIGKKGTAAKATTALEGRR